MSGNRQLRHGDDALACWRGKESRRGDNETIRKGVRMAQRTDYVREGKRQTAAKVRTGAIPMYQETSRLVAAKYDNSENQV